MKDERYWKLFEKTGNITAYLNYACASEERQEENRKEGDFANETGNSTGTGTFSSTGW